MREINDTAVVKIIACTLMNLKVFTQLSKGEMFLPLFGLKNKNYILISLFSFLLCKNV